MELTFILGPVIEVPGGFWGRLRVLTMALRPGLLLRVSLDRGVVLRNGLHCVEFKSFIYINYNYE